MKNTVRILAVLLFVGAALLIFQVRKAARMNNRAVALIEIGQYEKAIQILKTARRRFPENVTILKNLAKTLFEIGKKQEAREVYETILALEPSNVDAKQRLEQILNPDPVRARADARLKRMRKEGWKDDGMEYDSILSYAENAMERKDTRNAILYLERALFLNPKNLDLEQKIEELEGLRGPGPQKK